MDIGGRDCTLHAFTSGILQNGYSENSWETLQKSVRQRYFNTNTTTEVLTSFSEIYLNI